SELKAGEVTFDGPRGATHNSREAEAQTGKMVIVYHGQVAPFIEPLAIETRLEAEIEPGLVLSGQPDVVGREPMRIIDLKTGTRGPGTFQSQVGGYSMLARSHKIEIAEARIDYLKRVGIRSVPAAPVTRAIPIASAETAASNIIRRIADSLRIFRAGDP